MGHAAWGELGMRADNGASQPLAALSARAPAKLCAPQHTPSDERWWDAWRAFRRIGDCAAALTQQAIVMCPQDPALQGEVARWSVLW